MPPTIATTIRVTIYEQETCGQIHWRAMRDDGGVLFDQHQIEFPARDEAASAVKSDFHRRHDGPVEIYVEPLDRQTNGRNRRRILAASCDYR